MYVNIYAHENGAAKLLQFVIQFQSSIIIFLIKGNVTITIYFFYRNVVNVVENFKYNLPDAT